MTLNTGDGAHAGVGQRAPTEQRRVGEGKDLVAQILALEFGDDS